ncbi:hypothetical protein Q3304_08940 [Clostridioides sp. GD02377]|uniref:hypothetical protein n=1 Tax=unclassified Clostridioides TaxID=2635829 RepID=UPI0038AA118D
MTALLKELGYKDENEYREKIKSIFTKRTEKGINEAGDVIYKDIDINELYEHDEWTYKCLLDLLGLEWEKNIPLEKKLNTNIVRFTFKQTNLNDEFKFLLYNKLISKKISVKTLLLYYNEIYKYFMEFINNYYQNLNSILDFDIHEMQPKWLSYYKDNYDKKSKQSINFFLKSMYENLILLIDKRDIFAKDLWRYNELHSLGLIKTSDRKLNYNFLKIKNNHFRQEVKDFFKEHLFSEDKNISWASGCSYLRTITIFCNFIYEDSISLDKIEDFHIRNFLDYLKTKGTSYRDLYTMFWIIKTFTLYIDTKNKYYLNVDFSNLFNYVKSIETDRSYIERENISYKVLSKLLKNIYELEINEITAIWLMCKTGLTLNEVLSLTANCLIKENDDSYSLTVKCEPISIDSEVLEVLNYNIRKNISNIDNPLGYIFVKDSKNRKINKYRTSSLKNKINNIAIKKYITEEDGRIYKFNNEKFKIPNIDYELELIFEYICNNIEGELKSKFRAERIKNNMINNNGINTPYGVCLQNNAKNCEFAKRPPCLTCDNGNICKDLYIGGYEIDREKYELLITSIEELLKNDAIHINKGNEELLKLYESIYNQIKNGNIIYGRLSELRNNENESLKLEKQVKDLEDENRKLKEKLRELSS